MIIRVENLSKVYKKNFQEIHALKHINFTVEKNKILGVLGPNGAGKTTLLKILTGIIPPEKNPGALEILDHTDIEKVKHRMGFLPENPEFLKNITPAELLRFSLHISGASFDETRVDELLERVNLLREKNEKVKNFSKGMRQRIGIAQAVAHQPELLILDEPMSGLDPPGRRMVIDIIETYYREEKTVLFSTHNLDDIEALCTDVMVLTHGQIRLEKSLSQLREKSDFTIETEEDNKKKIYHIENHAELWAKLEDLKKNGRGIIKVQSGIARQLESYYETE